MYVFLRPPGAQASVSRQGAVSIEAVKLADFQVRAVKRLHILADDPGIEKGTLMITPNRKPQEYRNKTGIYPPHMSH